MEHPVFGYREICQGKSEAIFRGEKIIFRHQSIFDQCLVEEERRYWNEWSKNHGADDKNSSLAKAIIRGDWTTERESNFHAALEELRRMWSRRGKAKKIVDIASHVRSFHETIKMMQDEIDSEAVLRSMVTQDCYETQTERRCLDYKILLLSERPDGSLFFEKDDLEYIGDGELVVLRNLYSDKVLRFDDEYFEKLAVSSFFRDIFENYAKSPGDFFGKPAPDLTVFQISLLRQAKRFNKVMEIAYDAPDDFYDNPVMLETYAIVKNQNPASEEAGQDDVRQNMEEFARNRN